MVRLRKAEEKDAGLLLWFIKQIAKYERLSKEVTATEELLREWIFKRHVAEAIFLEEDGKPVGYVLYFFNFSTFTGKAGLYIEDLFVMPEYRGKGYGKTLFLEVAKTAAGMNLGRMEWTCLDWNKSSIDFYKSMGAAAMDEWTNYRLTEREIRNLVSQRS